MMCVFCVCAVTLMVQSSFGTRLLVSETVDLSQRRRCPSPVCHSVRCFFCLVTQLSFESYLSDATCTERIRLE